jgi:hypothetical protein
MALTVCLFANAIESPDSGGVIWEYLNWALGLRGLGCRVIWLEALDGQDARTIRASVDALKVRLRRYGLADAVAVCHRAGGPVASAIEAGCIGLEEAIGADLLITMGYELSPRLVSSFRRSVFVDVDPGLTQLWMAHGGLNVPPHDLYITTGETVGRPHTDVPDLGIDWHYIPPSVSLEWWPTSQAVMAEARFTTISQWCAEEWVGDEDHGYCNDKREGFLPFLSLPKRLDRAPELALCLSEEDDEERSALQELGWVVRDASTVAGTPWTYQEYIQGSLGEFSCAKPSCLRLQNAWVSDRTICYLASGKPAVVQHTGPSRFLPSGAGLFRFRTLDDAEQSLRMVLDDYPRQCRLARAIAEEHFDAQKNLTRVLEWALS